MTTKPKSAGLPRRRRKESFSCTGCSSPISPSNSWCDVTGYDIDLEPLAASFALFELHPHFEPLDAIIMVLTLLASLVSVERTSAGETVVFPA